MGNFNCDQCGAEIIDSPSGYITSCDHWPIEPPRRDRQNRIIQWTQWQPGMCDCHRCIEENHLTIGKVFMRPVHLSFQRMILCPTCGNKRCPKASDHRLDCTGSNEPGQAGSVYQ